LSRDGHRPRTGLLGWLWRLFVLLVVWLLGVTAWIVWVGERDQAARHLRAFLARPPRGPDAQKWIAHAHQSLTELGEAGVS